MAGSDVRAGHSYFLPLVLNLRVHSVSQAPAPSNCITITRDPGYPLNIRAPLKLPVRFVPSLAKEITKSIKIFMQEVERYIWKQTKQDASCNSYRNCNRQYNRSFYSRFILGRPEEHLR
jgi:hypothetical protein